LYSISISRRNDAAHTIEALKPHRRRHRNNTIATIAHLRCCQAASSSRHLNTHRNIEALWGAMSLWLHRENDINHRRTVALP